MAALLESWMKNKDLKVCIILSLFFDVAPWMPVLAGTGATGA